MRLTSLAVAVSISLAACGHSQGRADDNHGLGYAYDAESNGLKVRYLNADSPSIEYVDRMRLAVTSCMANLYHKPLDMPPALVVFVPSTDPYAAELGHTGWTWFGSLSIVIQQPQDAVGMQFSIAHEFVHATLKYNGLVSDDANASHQSYAFTQCVHLYGG